MDTRTGAKPSSTGRGCVRKVKVVRSGQGVIGYMITLADYQFDAEANRPVHFNKQKLWFAVDADATLDDGSFVTSGYQLTLHLIALAEDGFKIDHTTVFKLDDEVTRMGRNRIRVRWSLARHAPSEIQPARTDKIDFKELSN